MPCSYTINLKLIFLFISWISILGEVKSSVTKPSEIAVQSRGMYIGKPTFQAVYVDEGPIIDGNLNDEVWHRAMPAGDLLKTFPEDNASGTQSTEFRIIYDKENLYIGIWCFQDNPADITANAGNLADAGNDDHALVILDTFRDQRNAYAFIVTPNSLKADLLIGDQGRMQNMDWDTIWDAKCGIHNWGWGAEIMIPFKSISFDEDASTWGINLRRVLKKNGEVQDWANARSGVDPANPAQAGTITGLKNLKQGLGLDVLPFVTGTYTDDRTTGNDEFKADGGLDLRYRINAKTTAYLSINTDFADVEADVRQFNFTRFNQSFPEKRDFFLEDAGMFHFPSDGLSPYYSRKIGLSETGQIVPIHFAAKITSNQKNYNFGLMDVLIDSPEGERNVFVGRVRKNLENGSTIGLLSTFGDPRSNEDGYSVGADYQFINGEFMGDKSLGTKVWALGTANEAQTDSETKISYGAETIFKGRELTLVGAYSEVPENFNPPLGYVMRDDYRKYRFAASYVPRHEDVEWLNVSIHDYDLEIYTDTGNTLSDITNTITPIEFILESGDNLGYEIAHKLDRPTETFTIFDTSLPAGEYEGFYHRFFFNSDSKRKVVSRLSYLYNDGFLAPGQRYEAAFDYLPMKEFMIGVGYTSTILNWDHAPKTELNVVTGTSRINFNPDLSINNLLQYDNFSKSLGINSRLQWEYKPGARFYFVVNQTYLDERTGLTLQGLGTAVKLGGIFRF